MEGVFLKRGDYTFALDNDKKWDFKPLAKAGDQVAAGDWLGEVDENSQPHKIMVPFTFKGVYTVKEVAAAGAYTIHDTMAVLTDANGAEVKVTMIQRWPVKKAITCYREKPRPFKLLETGVRTIDTVNPIVEGGTGFIPGPFGTGKTVLQHAISKQAEADIVIIAACGERANEVVEVFTEFPELIDPHTGRKLMERTIIIANTSNMPVAAREASVYTAMTIAEYYRGMGLKVLLMADSTSRWAQALREMSNRLEELPGPDAFPMDLSAIVANFYARAGFVHLNNGATGSVTFIGTVSPAGGNLKEPVTENTKKVARCFYALEQERADRKRYPAVNPIDSYSKYLEYPEFQEYISQHISPSWIEKVNEVKTRMLRGKEIAEQINILGDDGVPVDYHVTFWKSELIDFVILQQDGAEGLVMGQHTVVGAFAHAVLLQILDVHVHEHLRGAAVGRGKDVDDGALGAVDAAVEEVHVQPGDVPEKGRHLGVVPLVHAGRVAVQQIVDADLQGVGDVVQRGDVHGDLAVFVFGDGGAGLVDGLGQLVHGHPAALPHEADLLAHPFCGAVVSSHVDFLKIK